MTGRRSKSAVRECGLILDFGGVITRTLFETHPLTERALGLPSGSLTWHGPFAPGTDALWVSMQNDEISERDYWQTRTQEVGLATGQSWTKMSEFVVAARGDADPAAIIRSEALRAIDTAKALGARLAILSNELDLFYGREFRDRLPFLTDFDVVVDATYTKILKPDARSYLQCANKMGVAPDCCVFVDDQARNVAGATAVGMRAVKFDVKNAGQSFSEALSELADLSHSCDHTKEHKHA